MLLALKKLYEARIAEHTSIIDIYLQKPVGICLLYTSDAADE